MIRQLTHKFTFALLLLCSVFLPSSNCFAESDPGDAKLPEDLTEIGLEALLNLDLDVSVASKTNSPLRSSPGIVNIITDEEIREMGARDLVDVLSTVPGIQFGQDVGGQIGIASRGIWAFEGRALFLLDGVKMSKIGYGTFTMVNHIPLESIKRIEIIRGPGSTIYGGNAELLVISIITKNAEEVNGASLTERYSVFANKSDFKIDEYGHRSTSASAGYKGEDVSIVGHIGLSDARLSNETYTSAFGESLDLTDNSEIRNLNANLAIKASDLTLRLISDSHRTEDRTRYGYTILSDQFPPLSSESNIFTIASDYKWELLEDKLTITPKFSYSKQIENGKRPGELDAIFAIDNESDALYDIAASELEYLGGVDVLFRPSDDFSVLSGTESFFQRAHVTQDPLLLSVYLNKHPHWMSGHAAYSQVTSEIGDIGTLTTGCRYDIAHYGDSYNQSFVPRASFTTNMDWLHLKLLYAQAFRSPNLATNLNRVSSDELLTPERSTSLEMELGGEIGSFGYLTMAIFHIDVKKQITYATLADGTQGLFNSDDALGTRGIEFDFRTKVPWGTGRLAYAFYKPETSGIIPHFMDPNDDSRYLAFSPHSLTGMTTFNLSDSITLTPSLEYLSQASAITGLAEDGSFVYSDIDSRLLLNLNLVANRVGLPGLTLALGAYNLLNDSYAFLQPYDGGHPPLPSLGREVMLTATYSF